MKISIVGSSKFAKEMLEYQNKLRELGHEVNIHKDYVALANNQADVIVQRIHKEHSQLKIENDYIRWHYNEIVNSDAILVLNFDKNGVANYVGGNTLMEIGFAHVHNKKIFLLNNIPNMPYSEEIQATQPIVLNNDLTQIS